MKYRIERIIRDLRIALRQNPAAATPLLESSQLTLDQWITSRLPAAVEAEHLAADLSAFDSPRSFTGSVKWSRPDIACGSVPLPDDFLRLIAFKMSDWHMAATTTVAPGSEAYKRQVSPHAGVRGNPWRPVCAIVPAPDGRILEFYSSRSTAATIEQALYIAVPAVTADDTIEIAPACYRTVLNRLAAEFNA